MNVQNTNKPYSEEGFALMGGAFEVHKEMGGGLLEEIYQECLELELGMQGIPFQSKQTLATFYKDRELLKKYVPDLVVHECILVELKAVKQLVPEHEAQLMNYMRIAKKTVGYLINFGPTEKVEWKRYVISEFLQHQRQSA